ncbi:MAG: DUF4230 domain-containing protein [Anaerolineae bacterium]|nr:DUF4230 domain-containing protein [Thermoflexales bacterium]MDW8396852.1 DUF4230 domain-containing protein [Anaerolineae bacterium]
MSRPLHSSAIVLAALIVSVGLVLGAVWVASALRAAAPQIVITREVVVTAPLSPQPTFTALPTLAPLPTHTPQPTFTPLPTFTPQPTFTPFPSPTPLPTPTPAPLPEWRRLSDLVVVEYTASTVVERTRPRDAVSDLILGKDRIVIYVVARVRLGVDLSRVRPSDVQVTADNRIRVRLSRPRVIGVELRPDLSRIYDASRSWLFSEYQGLEVEALDAARRQLLQDAQANAEMLELAEIVARQQLTEFLLRTGFQQVTIEFVD